MTARDQGTPHEGEAHPVILDCDNTLGLARREIDDGLALGYLLGERRHNLLGVTTTFGNGTVDEAYGQTRWLLSLLNERGVPVHRGAARRGDAATAAARFLAGAAAAHPGRITVVATGPLGNLRAAAREDPGFFGNLKRIVCMGGCLRPLRIGWRSIAELNLSSDPEAARAVLGAPCSVVLMNAQVCLQAFFGWREISRARRWRREIQREVLRWLLAFGLYCGVGVFYLWDLLPAVWVAHPELFDQKCVRVTSSAADLGRGLLSVTPLPCGEAAAVLMPSRIVDVSLFSRVLFDAWEQVFVGRRE